MKILISILLAIFPYISQAKVELININNKICYDGDTCYVNVWYQGIDFPKEERARIIGLDTPEINRSKCEYEKKLALDARDYLNNIIFNSNNIEIVTKYERDSFGRLLVEIYIDKNNVSLLLIKKGLGVKYEKNNRYDWCKNF